jgi:ABC-type molybdate transport system substrate-binding protein
MGQPTALYKTGKAGPVVLFARNRLCALTRPKLAVSSETLLAVMLDPAVRLATSTPKADPAGDYAWEIFRKAETVRPGSRERLEAKAPKLVGNPVVPQPPTGRNVYAWHLSENWTDLFLAYCTNAKPLETELPGARAVELPAELAVEAEYGLTLLEAAAAPRSAAALAFYILSSDGQRILRKHGFDAPLLRRE